MGLSGGVGQGQLEAGGFEEPAHFAGQLVGREGLEDHAVYVHWGMILYGGSFRAGAHADDGQGHLQFFPYILCCFGAVHAGHVHVEEHDIEVVVPFEDVDGFAAVLGDGAGHAAAAEDLADGALVELIVFDDEHLLTDEVAKVGAGRVADAFPAALDDELEDGIASVGAEKLAFAVHLFYEVSGLYHGAVVGDAAGRPGIVFQREFQEDLAGGAYELAYGEADGVGAAVLDGAFEYGVHQAFHLCAVAGEQYACGEVVGHEEADAFGGGVLFVLMHDGVDELTEFKGLHRSCFCA